MNFITFLNLYRSILGTWGLHWFVIKIYGFLFPLSFAAQSSFEH